MWLFLVGVVISYGCGYSWYMCGNCLRNGNWWMWLLLVGMVIDGCSYYGCCECRCIGILLVCVVIAGRSGSFLWES